MNYLQKRDDDALTPHQFALVGDFTKFANTLGEQVYKASEHGTKYK